MFKLIVESGPNIGEAFEVRERATIGRLKGAEVTIADASVSRQHARLLVQGDRLLVRDLDSANGIFVNGARVTTGEVRAGDQLRIGKVDLRIEAEETATVAPPPGSRPQAAPAPPSAPPSAPPQSAAPTIDRIATRTPTDPGPAAGGVEIRQKAKVLQYSPYARGPKDRGLLSSDLDQRSGLFKLAVVAALLAVALLLVLFSGRLVEWILPSPTTAPIEELDEDYGDEPSAEEDSTSR